MIRQPITHPDLLAGLARLGHGSQVLVADALFPHATGANPSAPRVQLNLCAGMVPADLVVRLVAETVHIEAATYMFSPEGDSEPVQQYRDQLADHRHWGGQEITWGGLDRLDFYQACRTPDLGLVVVTGDVRPYANLLLTVGVA